MGVQGFFRSAGRFSPVGRNLQMRSKKTMSLTGGNDFDGGAGSGGKRVRSIAPLYRPRSANQKKYVEVLGDARVPIVFGVGPAGCGKTLFACITAIDGLRRGSIQKIVLTRPVVPVEEEELGFLPGTLNKKMDPWTRPFFDIFLEYYPQRDIDFMLGAGVIEISPLAYMRGRTFKRAFVIADEMQNSTPNQMLMLLSRIGDGSKMVVTGDLKQSDRSVNNGLLDFLVKWRGVDEPAIRVVEMSYGDIERSPIVAKVLEIYRGAPKSGVDAIGDALDVQARSVDELPKAAIDPVPLSTDSVPLSTDSVPLPTDPVPLPKTEPIKRPWASGDAALIPSSHMPNCCDL
jgi:phosphate starvation-inducible PhoH-like protein